MIFLYNVYGKLFTVCEYQGRGEAVKSNRILLNTVAYHMDEFLPVWYL